MRDPSARPDATAVAHVPPPGGASSDDGGGAGSVEYRRTGMARSRARAVTVMVREVGAPPPISPPSRTVSASTGAPAARSPVTDPAGNDTDPWIDIGASIWSVRSWVGADAGSVARTPSRPGTSRDPRAT